MAIKASAGLCNNGAPHYCPNCDNSFTAADPELLAEVRRLQSLPQQTWQPIGTAPKDGRFVLLYGEAFHRRIWGRGYYFKGVPGDGEGWIAHSFYSGPANDLSGVFTPTHWMPLPDPPAVLPDHE